MKAARWRQIMELLSLVEEEANFFSTSYAKPTSGIPENTQLENEAWDAIKEKCLTPSIDEREERCQVIIDAKGDVLCTSIRSTR